MSFLQVDAHIPDLQPSILFNIGGWPISSSFMLMTLILMLFIIMGVIVKRSIKPVPGTFQNILEMLYEGIEGLLDQITRNRKVTESIFPMIGALFLFIGVSNLIGFVPGITSFTFDGHELFRLPTSDFNTTFALALAMMILVQIRSMIDWGFFGFVGRFIQIKPIFEGFKKGPGEGGMAITHFFIGLLDIISELAKVISLSMRLFGNIYAGEILLVIIFGALAYGLPALWWALAILMGVIQALVFGSLIAAYYSIGLKEEGTSEH